MSKRVASKPTKLLAQAPQQNKDKWEQICSLAGRNRSKTAKKGEFTDRLFNDPEFKDAYWEAEVSNVFPKKSRVVGWWMLTSKAINDHGSGETGKGGVGDAI